MKLNSLNEDIKNNIKDYTIFKPKNKDELQKTVDLWCSNKNKALNYYGHISNWNTILITNMSKLFYDKFEFNDDINNWDVSNVTNMESMFKGAKSFNQDVSQWNVSNVIDKSSMFNGASSFNQDISQ